MTKLYDSIIIMRLMANYLSLSVSSGLFILKLYFFQIMFVLWWKVWQVPPGHPGQSEKESMSHVARYFHSQPAHLEISQHL